MKNTLAYFLSTGTRYLFCDWMASQLAPVFVLRTASTPWHVIYFFLTHVWTARDLRDWSSLSDLCFIPYHLVLCRVKRSLNSNNFSSLKKFDPEHYLDQTRKRNALSSINGISSFRFGDIFKKFHFLLNIYAADGFDFLTHFPSWKWGVIIIIVTIFVD